MCIRDSSCTCSPNLVNFGPQTAKNRTGISTHLKSTFRTLINGGDGDGEGAMLPKIQQMLEDDQARLVFVNVLFEFFHIVYTLMMTVVIYIIIEFECGGGSEPVC